MEDWLMEIITGFTAFFGAVFWFYAKKGKFDRFFEKKVNRKIPEDEKGILKSHKVFSLLERILKVDISSAKKSMSDNKRAVTLYFLMYEIFIEKINESLHAFIESLPEEQSKQELALDVVLISNSFISKSEKEFHERNIPFSLIEKFDIFSLTKGKTFFTSAESIITNNIGGYYEEIDDYLDFIWTFSIWMFEEAQDKAKKFNGEVEVYLTDEIWNKIKI